MALGLTSPTTPTRFSWVVQGAPSGPDPLFDEDLASYADAVVLPTRGALVAEWLLIVPRSQCLSAAELDALGRQRLLLIAEEAAARVRTQVGSCVTFEHGAGRLGSLSGCGVDQAHLHIVGGPSISLETLASLVANVDWQAADHRDPWATIPAGSDYLVIRDKSQTLSAIVSRPVSQRLRRAVATALGRPDEWDYRSHPHAENALLTKQIFRGKLS